MALTRNVAMDCEMVGGVYGENLAARVTLVNQHCQVLLDEYIKPSKPIGDYRTSVSGITDSLLISGKSLAHVKSQVAQIINGRILVGHSLDGDLDALGLNHPEAMRRDLALYPPFKAMNGGQPASLKFLAQRIIGKIIQVRQHSSTEDAKAAMEIYLAVASKWN